MVPNCSFCDPPELCECEPYVEFSKEEVMWLKVQKYRNGWVASWRRANGYPIPLIERYFLLHTDEYAEWIKKTYGEDQSHHILLGSKEELWDRMIEFLKEYLGPDKLPN